MSEVRRDNKGRKLFNGESQRKDGKYEYKYQDVWDKRKTVYSWKLTPTDRAPAGKRDERQVRRHAQMKHNPIHSTGVVQADIFSGKNLK